MSSPIVDCLEESVLTLHDREILFVDFIEHFSNRYKGGMRNYNRNAIHKIVYELFKEHLSLEDDEIIPMEFMNVFDFTLPRYFERAEVIDKVLSFSNSIRIFGEQTWVTWPNYKKYYNGYLYSPQELRDMYQSTKINLHHGIPFLHTRALECMAAGGFLFSIESDDDLPSAMHHYFTPGEHYVPFNFKNL